MNGVNDEAAFAYTVASGRLVCTFEDLHAGAKALLGRPVMTHEFGTEATWVGLREAYEAELVARVTVPW